MWLIQSPLARVLCVYCSRNSGIKNIFARNLSDGFVPRICIVGSGPSGFGVTQSLLKNHDSLTIDIFEKLPIPFGLIRYGVSPDHQDVKNCINGYSRIAESSRVKFYGNVNVSKDVTLQELRSAYHAVILCYGAQEECLLGIPGQSFKNVFTSNEFVGWYNKNPDYNKIKPDLSGKTAVIVGVGNVALDCARMLMKPLDELKNTDINEDVCEILDSSNIQNVYLIGRRGPLQMACSRKELSELIDLKHIATIIEHEHFSDEIKKAIKKRDLKKRKFQRVVAHLLKVGKDSTHLSESNKNVLFKLLRTPLEIIGNDLGEANGIKLARNEIGISGGDVYNPEIKVTNTSEVISCDLIITSIGYKNNPLEENVIPFENGKIVQKNGAIKGYDDLYASGWCSHGATGVLAESSTDSMLTSSTVLNNLPDLLQSKRKCVGSDEILKNLKYRGIQVTSWQNWKAIDEIEMQRGQQMLKIREKVSTVEEMLDISLENNP